MWSHTTTHNHAQWLCGRLWRSEVSLTPLSGVLTWCGRPLGVSWQPREVRVAQDRICIGKKGVEENGLLDYIPISEVDSIEGAAHSHKASRHASMVNLFQKVDAVDRQSSNELAHALGFTCVWSALFVTLFPAAHTAVCFCCRGDAAVSNTGLCLYAGKGGA